VIRNPERLEAFERTDSRDRLADLIYSQALVIFAALWREARTVAPESAVPWIEDLEPDLAVARAVNGLPPRD
jgi:hypothetical protein